MRLGLELTLVKSRHEKKFKWELSMPDEVKPDPNQAQTQDAELVAESVAAGENKPRYRCRG